MLYYTKSARQTLEELHVSTRGLSKTEADERLRIHGPNNIRIKGDSLWRKLVEPFASAFMVVLLIAAAISLFHGDIVDAIIIFVIMFSSAAIYYVQRFSTERILRSLQKHTQQVVEVTRDGKIVELDANLLVPGDIITLKEGEKVPADARLIEAESLQVDESQLTGESVPIDKQTDRLPDGKEVYEQNNMLFQGSFIVSGKALAVVVTTGNETEFGRIASLTTDASDTSPVQKKIDKLLSQIIAIVAGLAFVTFGLSLLRGMDITESLRFVIALSVSAIPESLPVAISVVLVLGMRRMARKKALVRTMRAIETIGTITTIATDKTGTLTKNKLSVTTTWQPKHTNSLDSVIAKIINVSGTKMHDPLDAALHEYANKEQTVSSKHTPALTFSFDQKTAMSGNLWHHGSNYELAIKGAPEQVIARSDLTENEREEAEKILHQLTSEGNRVIAVAHLTLHKKINDFDDLKRSDKLTFDGFVAVADIVRPEAKAAIQTALKAGVTVRMITGDHFETAFHIGKDLGLVEARDQVFDSRKISLMSDEELEEVIDNVRVFSRVIPEHKYRILALLKRHDITAMTGDGVNDVPALVNAHVGVAMGSGTHIAKDAGDIILMDDNFKSIVYAMREGRTIFANIRRMLYYLLATNTGEVLTMLGALIIGIPLPLLPVQILWVNLVTDTAMVIPLGLEKGEKSTLLQKPYSPKAPILSKFMISRMILFALAMATVTLAIYILFSNWHGHEYGRTIAFSALVVMQWASAFNARSDSESLFKRMSVSNNSFYIGLAIAITLQLLVLFGPLGTLLHITPVAIGDLAITSAIAFIIPIILVEIHKLVGRRMLNRQ
jgi:Ca2+-transporting ATPase